MSTASEPEKNSEIGVPPESESPQATKQSGQAAQSANGPRVVVGIGASAGGLEALETFFTHVPVKSGLAFVVIQHLSPTFESHMNDLLGRVTKIPIHIATDSMRLTADAIYLLPPNKQMSIEDGCLWLSDRPGGSTFSHPIDFFFRSLAQDAGTRAVGVVLSGSGSDGSRGIEAISAAGGLSLAQTPATCKFDSMPVNANRTGAVHGVMAVEEMAQSIVDFSINRRYPAGDGFSFSEMKAEGIEAIFEILQHTHGVDFSNYRTGTISRRVGRRVKLNLQEDLPGYVDRLKQDPAEVDALYRDLMIGVTEFFRDPEVYETLQTRIIDDILYRSGDSGVRVWVCGCATGEEAYSLAMLFHEAILKKGRPIEFKMFATDAHHGSIQTAATGVYDADKLRGVSKERLHRFFHADGDRFAVKEDLRRSVVFARHDVMSDPPFTHMSMVSCRNMLIYLTREAQIRPLSRFHFALRHEGVMWLGLSESPGELKNEFSALDTNHKIYRKRRDVRLPIDLDPPGLANGVNKQKTGFAGGNDWHRSNNGPVSRRRKSDALPAIYDALLGQFIPPAVLVNEDFKLVHVFAGAEAYLRYPSGRPTSLLTEVIDPSMQTALQTALRQAKDDDEPVKFTGLNHPDVDVKQSVQVTVRPFMVAALDTMYFLVQFELTDKPIDDDVPRIVDIGEGDQARVEMLERELYLTRQRLQASVEEFEASNEELQATNEEMIASNEELQSTNEELQSVNEELHSVNAEHQRRLSELHESQADMENLLASTQVGAIFLDDELRIRRFTPQIGKILYLEQEDMGRRFVSLASRLDDEFLSRIDRVVSERIEQEWESRFGDQTYLIRALPYRTHDAVDGVIAAFVNVQSIKDAEAGLRLFRQAISSVINGIVITDPKLPGNPIVYVNRGFLNMTGYDEDEVLQKNCRFLQSDETSKDATALIRAAIDRGESCRTLLLNRRKDGTKFWNDLYITPVYDRDGELTNFVGVQNDVSERIHVGEQARDNEKTIRLLLDSTAEGIFGIDADGLCTFCNAAAARMLGYDGAEALITRAMNAIVRPHGESGEPVADDESSLTRCVQTGLNINRSDQNFTRRNGESFSVEYWCHPIIRDRICIGAVITFVDITSRLQIETELRDARDQADAANRAKTEFLANMSHELRTPLSAILGFTEILSEEFSEDSVLQKLQTIKRNGDYLLRLLGDVLDLSRIEAGKLTLNKKQCVLSELLFDVRETMSMRSREYDNQLKFQFPTMVPETVSTDAARVRQILINLIANALKFTPEGTIDVTVRWLQRESDNVGNRLLFEVRDTGVGISDQQQKVLFQPFSQADQSIGLRFGGTGLGLSITKRLVEALGGRIHVESELDRGSIFSVIIPVDPIGETVPLHGEREKADETEPVMTVPTLLRAKVLVADDVQDVRFIASHFLKANGCEVETASDGREAIDRIRQAIAEGKPHDLILMDVQMPVMGGEEAVARLRRDGYEAPIVALTADAMKGTRARLIAAGFTEYLTKPIEAKKLIEIVAGQIGGDGH